MDPSSIYKSRSLEMNIYFSGSGAKCFILSAENMLLFTAAVLVESWQGGRQSSVSPQVRLADIQYTHSALLASRKDPLKGFNALLGGKEALREIHASSPTSTLRLLRQTFSPQFDDLQAVSPSSSCFLF